MKKSSTGGAIVFVEGEDDSLASKSAACDQPADCAVTEYAGALLPGLFDCHV